MSSAAPTPEVRALPADVTIAKTVIREGHLYMIGSVKCPAAGVEEAYLLVDMSTGEIVLSAACGCRTGVPLSTLLLGLGGMLAKGHQSAAPGAPSGTQVH